MPDMRIRVAGGLQMWCQMGLFYISLELEYAIQNNHRHKRSYQRIYSIYLYEMTRHGLLFKG